MLAFPDVQLLDVAGPLQVFATANDLARMAGRPALYEPVTVADGALTLSSAGLGLATQPLPTPRSAVDTLIVAGGWGVHAACHDKRLVRWVKARAKDARRVASVCSGAFLLATAGLLDGRRAATHWSRCSEFATRFPKVRLEPDPIFVQDGKVWTSAGITAGIDLALALVEEDQGHELALAVARQLVVFLKRPGGQAQFSAALALQHGNGKFERLHAWIADHLTGDLSVEALADAAGMSERSFVRHYRAGDRHDAGTRGGTAAGGGRAPRAGGRPAGQARRAALRLRLGGDHAPQLPAPSRRIAAGLSGAVLPRVAQSS